MNGDTRRTNTDSALPRILQGTGNPSDGGRAPHGACCPWMDVLLVDDSATVRARLAEMLGEVEGISVSEAASGQEALRCVERKDFAVVVLDLNMPGQNGLELLSDLRRAAPRAHLIVLSNEAGEHHRREALARGAARFLDKSREYQQLVAVLGELPTT